MFLVFKALATKMTEELEFLKHTGGPGGMGGSTITDKNWRNRRSQKLDKMELLNLQSSLQSEIQAKQAISEELTKTRSDLIAAQKYVFEILFFVTLKLICKKLTKLNEYRELRDFRQRLDSMSHDMKRKEIQIKELQSRLDSGEGCKYPTIDSSISDESSSSIVVVRPQSYGNFISIVVVQAVIIHAIFVVCKHFNQCHGFFRK